MRLGEYDASSTSEAFPAQEFGIARTFIHPAFVASSLRNGIAIIRLNSTVNLGQYPTITTACLSYLPPQSGRCFVSGWGRSEWVFGRKIMKNLKLILFFPVLHQRHFSRFKRRSICRLWGPTFVKIICELLDLGLILLWTRQAFYVLEERLTKVTLFEGFKNWGTKNFLLFRCLHGRRRGSACVLFGWEVFRCRTR